MAQKIQLRTDTAANWTSANPVLAEGEMAVESNTAKFKLGNGVTAWNALAYGGVQGPAGTNGIPGVVAATSPITYDSGTQTVAITQSLIAINSSQVATTVTDKSANYTLVAGDKNSYIRSTGSAITITVPDVLANGESVNFIQAGAGQITFAGSGVTISSADSKVLTAKQFAGATVTKLGGVYYLVGNLG